MSLDLSRVTVPYISFICSIVSMNKLSPNEQNKPSHPHELSSVSIDENVFSNFIYLQCMSISVFILFSMV